MQNRAELKMRKQALQKELNEVEAELLTPSQETIDSESKSLRNAFGMTVGALCATLVTSLLALPYVPETNAEDSYYIYALAALAGSRGVRSPL